MARDRDAAQPGCGGFFHEVAGGDVDAALAVRVVDHQQGAPLGLAG